MNIPGIVVHGRCGKVAITLRVMSARFTAAGKQNTVQRIGSALVTRAWSLGE